MAVPHQVQIRDLIYLNWVKARLGLKYTKEGIESFIDNEAREFHTSLLKLLGQQPPQNCGQCTIDNLLPHKSSACPGQRHTCICSKQVNNRRDCPNNICGTLFTAIMSAHRFRGPAWKNSHMSQWVTDHWEVAKTFLPDTRSYINIESAKNTDLIGLVTIGVNLVNITERHEFKTNIFGAPDDFFQFRTLNNDILQNTSQPLTDDELRDNIMIMKAALRCTAALCSDPSSELSLFKLSHLEIPAIAITDENIKEVMQMTVSEEKSKVIGAKTILVVEQALPIEEEDEKQRERVVSSVKLEEKTTLDILGVKKTKVMTTVVDEARGDAIEDIESEGHQQVEAVKREGDQHIQKIQQAAMIAADAIFQENHILVVPPVMHFWSIFHDIPSDGELGHKINTYGRKHHIVDKMCKAVSKHFMQLCKEIKTITASYEISKENEVVFVIQHEGNADNIKKVTADYRVYLREVGCASKEAERVSYRKNYTDDIFSEDEDKAMNQVISKNSIELFNEHSNLNYLSGSRVKSVGFKQSSEYLSLTNKMCIVLYVTIKGMIPLQEDPFPKMIDGYPTDVMEGEFSFCHKYANDFHDDIKTGCEIFCPNSSSIGTIGPFVTFEKKKCFLTCSHVVCKPDEFKQLIELRDFYRAEISNFVSIYQPETHVPTGEVGKVIYLGCIERDTAGMTGMDVAVVEITNRFPSSGTFPDFQGCMHEEIGYSSRAELRYSGEFCDPDEIKPGDIAVIFGSQSGLRRGIVRTNKTSVRKTNFHIPGLSFILHNQIEIIAISDSNEPFAKGGDSGAIIFLKRGSGPLLALGLFIGCIPSSKQYIATPISEIYKRLDCSPLKFEESS